MVKISGVVTKGKQRGRKFGFPTVNIRNTETLEAGVYAGKTIVSGRVYQSAIFIPRSGDMVESYIFNFNEEIYGQNIEIKIDQKIREVVDFKSSEELVEQIKKDIELIKNL